jgi:hypothetical protein
LQAVNAVACQGSSGSGSGSGSVAHACGEARDVHGCGSTWLLRAFVAAAQPGEMHMSGDATSEGDVHAPARRCVGRAL